MTLPRKWREAGWFEASDGTWVGPEPQPIDIETLSPELKAVWEAQLPALRRLKEEIMK